MKSFSQFLQESYLNEAGVPDDYEEYMRKYSGTPKKLAQMSDADFNSRFGNNPKINIARDIGKEQQGSLFTRKGKPQDFRNPKKVPFTATDPIKQGQRSPLPNPPEASSTSPGQLEIPQGKTTKVKSPARRPSGAAADPFQQFPKKPQPQRGIPEPPSSRVPYGNRTLPGTPSRPALPAAGQTSAKPPKAGALATRPVTTPSAPAGTPSNPINIRTNMNVPGGKPPSTKIPGLKSGSALSAALSTADEKSKGSGWLRSLARGATVAAGTALGGIAGGAAGTAVAPGAGTAVGGYLGQAAGAAAADKAFNVAAGANAVQRKAMATANRRAQSGGALSGIGGKTTFDTKKGTMTTGVGPQQRTVKLGKTSVVTDPKTGKQDVGYLAYKGGKAVYKRADTKNLAQTSSNPLERIGRSLFAGAYKQSDAAAAAKKLAAARQSDVSRQKALGVKMKPGG